MKFITCPFTALGHEGYTVVSTTEPRYNKHRMQCISYAIVAKMRTTMDRLDPTSTFIGQTPNAMQCIDSALTRGHVRTHTRGGFSENR